MDYKTLKEKYERKIKHLNEELEDFENSNNAELKCACRSIKAKKEEYESLLIVINEYLNNKENENKFTEMKRDIIVRTLKQLSYEQLEAFIQKNDADFRNWYKATIDGEVMPWWALECEFKDLKQKYGNIKFELIPYTESLFGWWK